MTPTKLLIGQIIVVFAIVIAGLWAATQWAAAMLAYQPQLGPPWFTLFHTPIYRPWAIFPWWYHYDAYAPQVFDKAGVIAGASGFVGCAAAIFGSLWRARQQRHVTTYGSARWAEVREMERAGLLGDAGAFLGRHHDRYLRHDGPEHVMAFAPTRSGKGVGLVVPTLLSWTGSAVIHDIKGENWQLTAGWRSRFSHALLFNPTDARSAHYNPLLEVRRGENEVRDVQNIADILVDPVITTDRHTYHLQLESTATTAMSALSWTYPQDELRAIKRAADQHRAATPVASGLAVEQLNFGSARRNKPSCGSRAAATRGARTAGGHHDRRNHRTAGAREGGSRNPRPARFTRPGRPVPARCGRRDFRSWIDRDRRSGLVRAEADDIPRHCRE